MQILDESVEVIWRVGLVVASQRALGVMVFVCIVTAWLGLVSYGCDCVLQGVGTLLLIGNGRLKLWFGQGCPFAGSKIGLCRRVRRSCGARSVVE